MNAPVVVVVRRGPAALPSMLFPMPYWAPGPEGAVEALWGRWQMEAPGQAWSD
jgi:hypothetical protein